MGKFGLLARLAAVALVPLATNSASAQSQIFSDDEPSVFGKYRSGNTVRVTALMGRRGHVTVARAAALQEVARMTVAKGYSRFAVVKISECGILMMNRTIPVHVSCRIVARMLGPDEVAKPEGRNPVTYYRTAELLAEAR